MALRPRGRTRSWRRQRVCPWPLANMAADLGAGWRRRLGGNAAGSQAGHPLPCLSPLLPAGQTLLCVPAAAASHTAVPLPGL